MAAAGPVVVGGRWAKAHYYNNFNVARLENIFRGRWGQLPLINRLCKSGIFEDRFKGPPLLIK